MIDGKEEGVRLLLFDYSQKELVGAGKEEELIQKEIKRVKNLPGTTNTRGGWIKTQEEPSNVFYGGDPISLLKGVGPKIEEKLCKNKEKYR